MNTRTPLSRIQGRFLRIPFFQSPHRVLFLCGALLLILVISLRIMRGSSQSVSPTPSLLSPTGSEGAIVLQLQAEWPSVPTRLPLYQLSGSTPLQTGLQAIAQTQGLTQSGEYLVRYQSANGNETYLLLPQGQGIDYSNLNHAPQAAQPLNVEAARQATATFLEKLGFDTKNLDIQESFFQAESDDQDELNETTDTTKAIALTSRVQQKIDGYHLVWEAGNVEEFILSSSNTGVYKAILSNFPFTFDRAGQRQTLTQEEVLDNLAKGNYVVVGTVGFGQQRSQLKSIVVESVEVEYRASNLESVIAPYLKITGQGGFGTSENFPVTIVTPLAK